LFSLTASAAPLYELGVAAGGGYLPDYPASDEGRVRLLVLPNFRYRGKVFRADEESGLRARLFKNKNYDFDLSFGGAFPVNTGENRARKDMEALDWLVEFGPRLFAILWYDPFVGRLRFGLPVRAVFSTDGTSATHRGFVAVPGFLGELFFWPCADCRLYAALGPTFATEGVGDYFYQVEQKDVTSSRPAFNGKQGYTGTDLTVGISYTKQQFEMFFGGRASSYAGAANQDSPLFKRKENFAGFFAIGWLFYTSSAQGQD